MTRAASSPRWIVVRGAREHYEEAQTGQFNRAAGAESFAPVLEKVLEEGWEFDKLGPST